METNLPFAMCFFSWLSVKPKWEIREENKGKVENGGGNAENRGRNAGNIGGNAGNRGGNAGSLLGSCVKI